jgi:hypothetical protein
VGTIVYEIDQHPYQNTFYNGTIEVVEPGVLFSMESVFLFTLGIALLVLLGIWINGQMQNLSKVIQCFLFFKTTWILPDPPSDYSHILRKCPLRKQKDLPRLKSGLRLQMLQWMNGFRCVLLLLLSVTLISKFLCDVPVSEV